MKYLEDRIAEMAEGEKITYRGYADVTDDFKKIIKVK